MPDRGLITDPYGTPIINGPIVTPIIPNQNGGFGSPISLPPRQIMSRATPTQQRQDNVSAVNEPCRVVLGQDRIGAQLLTGLLTSPVTGNLLIVVVWCRGPITSIANVTVNNVAISSGVLATHYLGTATQTVDPKLVTAFSGLGITHTYTFPGIAYSVFEFPVSEKIGTLNAIINGVQPYDPRNVAHVLATPSTWTYSNNPALLLAHIISNTSYGMGGTVDWSGSTAAFDACDAVVTSEVKRTIGYTMDKRLDSSSVCDILRAHAGCFVVRSAGKFKLIPDAAASSTATVSKVTTTLIDKSVKWQLAGLMNQPNVVEVAWTDTSVIPWRSAVAVVPANAVPPTGEYLRLTRIDLPGCQRYSQAMREAIERRNHGRLEPLTITIDTYAESLAIEPGDVYTLDDAGAFTGTLLRLLTRSMGRKGRFTLTGKKYDPATYSSSADAAPTYKNTNLNTVDWARGSDASAVASSALSGFPASAAIIGDVSNWGPNIGGWNSNGVLPQNLEVDFVAAKVITEIVVITLRDAYNTANVPTIYDRFTAYGITSFTVEYWTGAAWSVVSGGTVTGNTNVMRRFPVVITTTKVRVNVTASVDGTARIVALQVIG